MSARVHADSDAPRDELDRPGQLDGLDLFERLDPLDRLDHLDVEFEHHLDMIAREEMAAGASPEEARERALRRFGDRERTALECGRIMKGWWHMTNQGDTAKAARLVGVTLWRVAVAATLGFCVFLGWNANVRAIEASNLAAVAAQRTGGAPAGTGALSPDDRAGILASIWGPTSGEIEVRGAVMAPGKFRTDTNAPLDLATLLERAGGAAPGAKSIIWNQRGEPGEAFVSLSNAMRFRGDFNSMPAPGSVITVR